MKTTFRALPLFILVACLMGCGDKNRDAAPPSPAGGMYVGLLPCADCPGILTQLTFNRDGTAALSSEYRGAGGRLFLDKGTWTEKDGLIHVNFGSETQTYKIKSASDIILTGPDGKVSETMPEAYLLHKRSPLMAASFAGHYEETDAKGVPVGQELDIAGISEDGVRASVKAAGPNGCTFSATGTVVNDQIEIPLKEIRPDLDSVMLIRFTVSGKLVRLFTADPKTGKDLSLFCPKGKSLAGMYLKVR